MCEIFSEPKWLFKCDSNALILLPSFPFSLCSYNEHSLCLKSSARCQGYSYEHDRDTLISGDYSLGGSKAKIRDEYDQLFIEISTLLKLGIH